MGDTTRAIITVISEDKREVRCGLCGKLLFIIDGTFKKQVDFTTQNVIIVSRCTRNSCKADNLISIGDIL